MIIVKKTGQLFFLGKKYKCALGYAGIKKNKKEGDGATPSGIYSLIKIYYRKDKIKKIQSTLKKIVITKKMIWCDDNNSRFYNTQSNLPKEFSYEKLYRKDNIYDIIVVINYNINPVKKIKAALYFYTLLKKIINPLKDVLL